MKILQNKVAVWRRWLRLRNRKQNNTRMICRSMIAFERAPIANINELTGRLVRENRIKLYH